MTSDLDLLGKFARENSQDAFAELVRRHLDLVYSTALRQVRSPQLAEEIAQSVFADLARQAANLEPGTVLTAWLYAVTRRTAIDSIRKESRRQLREQVAVEMNNMNATAEDWTQIEPLLDDAMAALDETDRVAVLLRYFENKSLREVGEALGASEDAAQKRVSRAVERLREFFSKRNVTVGAGGLAALISANAVQSAPIGLAAAISSAAVLAGAAVSTSTVVAATKIIAMTTLQKSIVGAALVATLGTGIFEANQAAQLRDQVQTLRQQRAPLAEQIRELQRERDDATNRLAGLLAENDQLRANQNEVELLKLRGRIGLLQSQIDDPVVRTVLRWRVKEAKLRRLMNERPDQQIPEMQFLTDQQWLDIARDADLDSQDGIRAALSTVRNEAKSDFAPLMQKALNKYADAHNGNFPDTLSLLSPYFDTPVDDTILQRYQLLDKTAQGKPNGAVVIEKSAIDPSTEGRAEIGLNYISTGSPAAPGPQAYSFPAELTPVLKSYYHANNGQFPKDFTDLRPYITTPEQTAALERLLYQINH